MQLTAIDLVFGASAAALAALVALVLKSDGPSGAESYTLHVAFTPWGPDVLHWWIRSSSSSSVVDVKKGDLL
jgi:hypothetical protein